MRSDEITSQHLPGDPAATAYRAVRRCMTQLVQAAAKA